MSEKPNTKNPETEKGSETLTKQLYELSQHSPREFAQKWADERDGAELGLPELEDSFRKKFVEQGGEDPNLAEMSEENKRMLYSLRVEGNELGFIFNQLASEAGANPAQAESLARFIKEQDARALKEATEQNDSPFMPGDSHIDRLLASYEDSSVDSSAQNAPVEDLGDIQSRLNPDPSEPLSEATKKGFFDLSLSADQTFQEKLDRLDNEQQKEVRAYIKQSYENMKVAAMSPEDRKQYFAAQKEKLANEQAAAANEARQDALEVAVAQEPTPGEVNPEVKARRENPQTEEDFEELHALKLANGAEFKDVYMNKLSPEQQVKFDAREAKYDARIMVEDPDFLIPRLSRRGEWTSMSGLKPENEPAEEAKAEDNTRPFNREYHANESELKNLAELASSSNPEDKKAYADAVRGMPAEKFAALSKYRAENSSGSDTEPQSPPEIPRSQKVERRIDGPLSEGYLRSMYKDAHSSDPRLREAFAAESRDWNAVERNQYVQYSATLQTEIAEQERQQPPVKQGPIRRWWGRLRGKK